MSSQFSQPSMDWTEFCDSRIEWLTILAETVEQGFRRRDTEHPAFCGCIDWHSSVHGAYALLTVSRVTGQIRLAATVDAALTTDSIDAELSCLRADTLDQEMPYGFSWFLKLAIEREQGWGKEDLRPLAKEIATRLGHWMFSLRAGEVIRHCQRREYGNFSWALLNLWHWSLWTADRALMEKLLTFTRSWIVLLDEALPPSYDSVTDEFFAASLQRTRAILSILPSEEAQIWLTSFYQEGCSLEPLLQMATPHSAGLNFSRAWGFWTLYQSTQDEIFRDLYVKHIMTHMNLPECWRTDYRKHAHWVPQFGIYAIALSMDGNES